MVRRRMGGARRSAYPANAPRPAAPTRARMPYRGGWVERTLSPPRWTVSPFDVVGSPWSGRVFLTSFPSVEAPVFASVTPDWVWFAGVPAVPVSPVLRVPAVLPAAESRCVMPVSRDMAPVSTAPPVALGVPTAPGVAAAPVSLTALVSLVLSLPPHPPAMTAAANKRAMFRIQTSGSRHETAQPASPPPRFPSPFGARDTPRRGKVFACPAFRRWVAGQFEGSP